MEILIICQDIGFREYIDTKSINRTNPTFDDLFYFLTYNHNGMRKLSNEYSFFYINSADKLLKADKNVNINNGKRDRFFLIKNNKLSQIDINKLKYDNVIDRLKNHNLETYKFADYLYNYPDVITLFAGRIVVMVREYNEYQKIINYLINNKLGTSIIAVSGLFFILGLFSTLFFVLFLIFLLAGVFIRNSEIKLDTWFPEIKKLKF